MTTVKLHDILAQLAATSGEENRALFQPVIEQVGEWLKTDRYPHVRIWDLVDCGRSLYITVGTSEQAANHNVQGESVSLHFRVDRDPKDRRIIGLRIYAPETRLVNYRTKSSTSYIRPGSYGSTDIPVGITPEQIVAWAKGETGKPDPAAQSHRAGMTPAKSRSPSP